MKAKVTSRDADRGITRDALSTGVVPAALAMIVIATALRLWRIADPATLNLHIIRQMVEAMQARNFAEGQGSIMRPLVDLSFWPTPTPWSLGLEFPIVPLMAAGLFALFGPHVWLGNLLAVAFSALAAWVFYLTARKVLVTEAGALFALLVFLFTPEAYKYTRTFQPESLALLLSVFCVYACLRWTERETAEGLGSGARWQVALTLAFGALLLNKAVYAYVGLPMLAVVIARLGWRRLARWDVGAMLAVAIAPSAVYYPLANLNAEFSQAAFTAGQAATGVLRNWSDPTFWRVLWNGVSAWFFLPGVLVALVGLALAVRDRARALPRALAVWWLAGVLLYLYVLGRVLGPHIYYFMPLLPIGSLLVGRAVDAVEPLAGVRVIARGRALAALAVAGALVAAAGSAWLLRGYYAETHAEMASHEAAASLIEANTEPGDLIVAQTEDWGVGLFITYEADRRGWTISETDASRFLETVAAARRAGARYLFVSSAPFGARYFDVPTEQPTLAAELRLAERTYPVVARSSQGVLFRLP